MEGNHAFQGFWSKYNPESYEKPANTSWRQEREAWLTPEYKHNKK